MKQVVIFIFIVFFALWMTRGCQSRRSRGQAQYNQNVTVTAAAADGLDLQAVLKLVKDVKNAQELEKQLNRKNGINNLDLNEDGTVDFIKVTEYGNKNDVWGFSLTTEPVKGEVQEIATIEIEKAGDSARVEARGNEHVYGHNHYYHSRFGVGDFLLWSYLLSPHRYYSSPWGWGSYPSYYSSYSPINRYDYRNRTRQFTSGTNIQRAQKSSLTKASSISSPNRNKVANRGITQKLANPTQTQKQFQTRNVSRRTGSGGFGRRSSQTRQTRSPSRARSSTARSFSRSRSSFGGYGK